MVSLPPGWERVVTPPQAAPAPAAGPTLPPGWERVGSRVTYSGPEQGEVLRLPGVPPAPPSRPTVTPPGTSEDFMRNLGKIDETVDRYGGAFARTVGHNLLPSLVEQETPEQGRMFDEAMTQVALMLAGGLIGRGIGSKAADALKFIGRGFRGRPAAQQFIASNPVRAATASGQGIRARDILGPAVSGTAVNAVLDRTDLFGMQPHEFGGDLTAAGAGTGAALLVAKDTIDDVLLSNPRWQNVMMRPSSGAASGVLGAVLGYLASRGLIAGKDQISDAVDYVSSLFADDDQGQGRGETSR